MTLTNTRPGAFPQAVALRAREALDPNSDAGEMVSAKEVRAIMNAAPGAEAEVARGLSASVAFRARLTPEAQQAVTEASNPGNFFDQIATAKVVSGPAASGDLKAVADTRLAKEARADALFNDPNVRLALMDPSMLRTEGYQKFVDMITNSSVYKTYHRDVREMLKAQVSQIIADSEITGTLVDETNIDEPHLHLFTKKLYEMVQETAREAGVIGYEGGPQAVELKILSDTKPNAYVYGLWNEKPRVHVISAIADVFFDNERGDWVSDEAKSMLQSVIAHELWHIKDNPAEWRTWFGILMDASGLLEEHADGPLFTAAQKQEMIAQGKALVSKAATHTACKSACCATGFQAFVANKQLSDVSSNITAQLGITAEEATKTLVQAFGIDLEKRRGIERDEDGQPTKFGILQAIFQDSYQLTRAGEIAADRGAFLVQGTNEWTAYMDMLLGVATDFNSFADTDAEKRAFMERLLAKGYKSWVAKQRQAINEGARAFNLPGYKEALNCVTHPPSLPRVILGMQYMDRKRNPDAFPMLVQELQRIENPTAKTMEVLRVLQKGKHESVTRFVDPRGFDKADATARVQHSILYDAEQERWNGAIKTALAVLDELVSDEDLMSASSKQFNAVVKGIDPKRNDLVVEAWRKVPMEQVTGHFIDRLEGLRDRVTGEARKVLDDRVEQMWQLHRAQLQKEKAVFSEPTRGLKDRMAELLRAMESVES